MSSTTTSKASRSRQFAVSHVAAASSASAASSTRRRARCSRFFPRNVIRDAVTYYEHAKRKTVSSLLLCQVEVEFAGDRDGRRLCAQAPRQKRSTALADKRRLVGFGKRSPLHLPSLTDPKRPSIRATNYSRRKKLYKQKQSNLAVARIFSI